MQRIAGDFPVWTFGRARSSWRLSPPGLANSMPASNVISSGGALSARSPSARPSRSIMVGPLLVAQLVGLLLHHRDELVPLLGPLAVGLGLPDLDVLEPGPLAAVVQLDVVAVHREAVGLREDHLRVVDRRDHL